MMFELPEERDDWRWSGNLINWDDPGLLTRSWRLRELEEEEEYLRNELSHCPPPHVAKYIYEQIDDLERRKENILRSFY